jgi:membrane protein
MNKHVYGHETAGLSISFRHWLGAPWRRMFLRAIREFIDDDIPTVAAGATFYILLAFFPTVAAFVSLYGLFANIDTAREHLSYLSGFLPGDVLTFVGDEMIRVTTTHTSKLSGTFILSLVISLWSANAGVSSLITGLNVAYEQKETRSFIVVHLLSLAITIGAIFAAIAAFVLVVAIPIAESFLGLGGFDFRALFRWPLMAAGSVALIAVLFRYGPNCQPGGKRRVLLGAIFATFVWLLGSLAFSWYLGNFGHYDRTYGSLGTMIGFMMWVWLGVMVILFGAELNSEIERVSHD